MFASLALSTPPFRISERIEKSKSEGNPTMFKAIKGVAPIAYTSLKEFDAEMAPNK